MPVFCGLGLIFNSTLTVQPMKPDPDCNIWVQASPANALPCAAPFFSRRFAVCDYSASLTSLNGNESDKMCSRVTIQHILTLQVILRSCMHCSVIHHQSTLSNTAVPKFFFSAMHLTITTNVYKSAYKTDFTRHTYNAYPVGHIYTALQAGRSWVRILMVSLEFFTDVILAASLWPYGRLSRSQ
jgi:hypothetical protein